MSAAMHMQHEQMQHQDEYENVEPAPRRVMLPAIAISPEREQAIATVDQRPEAAVRVTRNWLRV
ncbi:MAG: hypothetical protein ABI852_05355 [Gemmatimonadaceae bacterium]